MFSILFSITIYATTINTENSPFVNNVKNTEYDHIIFAGNNAVFDVKQYTNLSKGTDENSGNIIISENTTATINAYKGTEGETKLDGVVYLQYTTTDYIKGEDKSTSYLNLNWYAICTKNNKVKVCT